MDFNYVLLILIFIGLGGLFLANFFTWQQTWSKKLFLNKKDIVFIRTSWANNLIIIGSNFLIVTFLLSFVLPSGFYTNFNILGFYVPVYLWLLVGSSVALIVGFFSYYIFRSKSFSAHKFWDKKTWEYEDIEFVNIHFSRKSKPHFELEIRFSDEEDLNMNFLGTDIKDINTAINCFEQENIKVQMQALPTPEEYQNMSSEEKQMILPYLPEIFPK
ncbi:MAG: hypothetical protein MUC49_13740 [Raineya sp.]|jgi:hypothetical protein|nr:hypothetical protein [Raineya sp.]